MGRANRIMLFTGLPVSKSVFCDFTFFYNSAVLIKIDIIIDLAAQHVNPKRDKKSVKKGIVTFLPVISVN